MSWSVKSYLKYLRWKSGLRRCQHMYSSKSSRRGQQWHLLLGLSQVKVLGGAGKRIICLFLQSETWTLRQPVWSDARRRRSQWHQTELPSRWLLRTMPLPPWEMGRTPWDKCKMQQHLLPPEWSEDFTYTLICCCTCNWSQQILIPVQTLKWCYNQKSQANKTPVKTIWCY